VWADGTPLIVSGTVFGLDSKKPLPFSTLDLWQAIPGPDAEYDYFEPDGKKYPYKEEINMHGSAKDFAYRARAVTNQDGQYEISTMLPPPYYDPDDGTWRCPHIHYWVNKTGYKSLVTQLYFEGQEKNDIGMHFLFAYVCVCVLCYVVLHQSSRTHPF
jgi:catechol 1,2-dioxygenase